MGEEPPNFNLDFTKGDQVLEDLNALGLQIMEYENYLDFRIFQTFVDRFVKTFQIDPETLPKSPPSVPGELDEITYNLELYKVFAKLKDYLQFQSQYGMVLEELRRDFPSDYNLYVSIGSAGQLAGILPQDKAFFETVLTKQPKHLFLIFDESEGESETFGPFKYLMELHANTDEKGKHIHNTLRGPIGTFLGAPVLYRRISDNCFEYKVIRKDGNPQEVRFVFFNRYFDPILINTIRPLLTKAVLRFLICTIGLACDSSVLLEKRSYVNTFDFYISNQYSKSPYFTEFAKFKMGNQTVNNSIFASSELKIVNLRDLRKHTNKNLLNNKKLNKTALKNDKRYRFNKEKLAAHGIPFKLKGDPTFWTIVKGGTRKRNQRKSRRRRV